MTPSEIKMKRIYESQGWDVIHNGLPDFLLYKFDNTSKLYSYCWKEIKGRGDKLSEIQKNVLGIFKLLGFSVEVVRPSKFVLPKIIRPKVELSREKKMKDLLNNGLTYEKVGKIFGISKQRAYHILNPNQEDDIKDDIIVPAIVGRSRKGEIITIRHLLMFLLRERLGLSYPTIAKIMNKKDHTTIISACKKIKIPCG